MSANRFEVSGTSTNLSGTVLLALRNPTNPKYPSRIVEVDRQGRVVWEHRSPGDVRLITDK
jgi:hypothetical protein